MMKENQQIESSLSEERITDRYIFKEELVVGTSEKVVRKVMLKRNTSTVNNRKKRISSVNERWAKLNTPKATYRFCKSIAKASKEVDGVSNNDSVDSLLKEAAHLESVQGHPHIVEVDRVYEDEDRVYIVTELCEGGTLAEKIEKLRKSGRGLANGDAAHVIRSILDGISHCHEAAGVAHGNLNACNIMFKQKKSTGRFVRDIRFVGFGSASNIHSNGSNDAIGCKQKTPTYAAPELGTDDSYDRKKADVWSIGALAYLILSLSLPSDGKNEEETIHMLRSSDEPTLYQSKQWTSVEPEAIEFCKWLLNKVPKKRPTAPEALNHPWIVKHCGETAVTTTTYRTKQISSGSMVETMGLEQREADETTMEEEQAQSSNNGDPCTQQLPSLLRARNVSLLSLFFEDESCMMREIKNLPIVKCRPRITGINSNPIPLQQQPDPFIPASVIAPVEKPSPLNKLGDIMVPPVTISSVVRWGDSTSTIDNMDCFDRALLVLE